MKKLNIENLNSKFSNENNDLEYTFENLNSTFSNENNDLESTFENNDLESTFENNDLEFIVENNDVEFIVENVNNNLVSTFSNVNNDLESGTNINTNINTAYKINISAFEINLTMTESNINSESKMSYCIKFGMWLLLMIFSFPIPFCDLYYGYTDKSCINEPIEKFPIDLKDYLKISGFIMMYLLCILSIIICINNKYFSNNCCLICCSTIYGILFVFIQLFIFVWNIIGAIIFWYLMNTVNCSNNIYNYVFASLIIKLFVNIINIHKHINKKK